MLELTVNFKAKDHPILSLVERLSSFKGSYLLILFSGS